MPFFALFATNRFDSIVLQEPAILSASLSDQEGEKKRKNSRYSILDDHKLRNQCTKEVLRSKVELKEQQVVVDSIEQERQVIDLERASFRRREG